jgi:Flagellar biosynthesis protein, FliO
MEVTPMEITRTPIRMHARPNSPRIFALAARLQAFWQSGICHLGIRRQRKTLAVRETAALGDRRFVSVIQFERRRFLIGSSPSSVTLLAQLPDESVAEEGKKESGVKD